MFDDPEAANKKRRILPSKFENSSQPAPRLSEEQHNVIQMVKDRYNVFFTGSAGTGKSYLMREICSYLQSQYMDEEIAITGSTGMAACNVNGCTLHSFAGVGLGHGTKEELYNKVIKNKASMNRWRRTKVLVIDESTI